MIHLMADIHSKLYDLIQLRSLSERLLHISAGKRPPLAGFFFGLLKREIARIALASLNMTIPAVIITT